MRELRTGHGLLLLAVVGMLGFLSSAGAQSPALLDITLQCKFHLSASLAQESRLFDCDANTYWRTGRGNQEGYIQLWKPEGPATLSVLWARMPVRVVLESGGTGESAQLAAFGDIAADAPPVLIPESFALPGPAGMYRLRTEGSAMAVAELRVHAGTADSFFSTHGYPYSPTLVKPQPTYRKPLGRTLRVNVGVKWMQQRLKQLGYYDGPDDGRLGEKTYLSLLRFQRENGLYPSGTYEPATICALEDPKALPAPPALPQEAEERPRTSNAFLAYLQKQVGAGYIYGGMGQVATPTARGAAVRLYPQYEALLKGYAQRWDGLRVFDCIGLIKAFLEASEGGLPDALATNVNGALQKWQLIVSSIETMPRQPGMLLLQAHPTEAGSFIHIGVYLGEGKCIHARGHRYGVVVDPMPQLWTHWARPSWLQFDSLEEPETPWPPYMAAGEWVLVDSSDGDPVPVYSQPVQDSRFKTGISLPNYTDVRIEQAPPELPYWRVVTVPDDTGQPVMGYVFARELSLLP